MTVDVRTRPISVAGPVDPEAFFEVDWREAVARNGLRAATDAALLALGPLTIRVDDGAWTITPRERTIDVVPGGASSEPSVTLDRSAFADLFCERRTAMGLIVGERVGGLSSTDDPSTVPVPCRCNLLTGPRSSSTNGSGPAGRPRRQPIF
jgi:hypothetical protein